LPDCFLVKILTIVKGPGPACVPQGSIFGYVLFIIYINDLIESCGEDAKIYLFADDAKLYNHK